jgi:hypothetical protein
VASRLLAIVANNDQANKLSETKADGFRLRSLRPRAKFTGATSSPDSPISPAFVLGRSEQNQHPEPLGTHTARVITRSQSRRKKAVFEFFSLPPELRMLVYENCAFSFDGIDKVIAKSYQNTRCPVCYQDPSHYDFSCRHVSFDSGRSRIGSAKVPKQTPGILLVNRQMYCEALPFVYENSRLELRHAYAPVLHNIPDFISLHTLSRIQHIHIHTPHLRQPGGSYLRLRPFSDMMTDLVEALSAWHNGYGYELKTLTVDLRDSNIAVHLESCMQDHHCYFYKLVKEALESLQVLSRPAIGKIELKGIFSNECMKTHKDKAIMCMNRDPVRWWIQRYGEFGTGCTTTPFNSASVLGACVTHKIEQAGVESLYGEDTRVLPIARTKRSKPGIDFGRIQLQWKDREVKAKPVEPLSWFSALFSGGGSEDSLCGDLEWSMFVDWSGGSE